MMTFQGATYEAIIDIERLIIVSECRLDIYELEIKKFTQQCDKIGIAETKIKINIELKFLEEVKQRRDFLLEEMDKLSHDLNDIEYKVFIEKFIRGKSNTQIQDELFLPKSTYHRICDHIANIMETTPYGEDILECLKV